MSGMINRGPCRAFKLGRPLPFGAIRTYDKAASRVNKHLRVALQRPRKNPPKPVSAKSWWKRLLRVAGI